MFILLPTHDISAPTAEISLGLLQRYWPEHPIVKVLHHGRKPAVRKQAKVQLHDRRPDGSNWLGNIRSFLETPSDELFLLFLDDYALCAPPRMGVIAEAQRIMLDDRSIGLFPLCWYPAARREPRNGCEGIVTLTGTPILLQAAIWRRSWFLELARDMDARTSPWGFEALATRKARKVPMGICAAQMPTPAHIGGHLIDGMDKADWPLPYHNLMHRGQPELRHEAFLQAEGFALPSRGLGDTIAKGANASGIAYVVEKVSQTLGRDCGCQRRREALNRLLPYG